VDGGEGEEMNTVPWGVIPGSPPRIEIPKLRSQALLLAVRVRLDVLRDVWRYADKSPRLVAEKKRLENFWYKHVTSIDGGEDAFVQMVADILTEAPDAD
jgi:hypothetical protein